MADAEEVIDSYRSSLADLTINSKPLISMLTMLAEDHIQYAQHIVQLIEQHLQKTTEEVLAKLIRDRVDLDVKQFGLVPGRVTTNAIFLVRHLQEKFLAKNKLFYLPFIGLKKVFGS